MRPPSNGFEVVAHEEYAPGTRISPTPFCLQNAGAEVLLSLPIPPDGITLFTQMAELG